MGLGNAVRCVMGSQYSIIVVQNLLSIIPGTLTYQSPQGKIDKYRREQIKLAHVGEGSNVANWMSSSPLALLKHDQLASCHRTV